MELIDFQTYYNLVKAVCERPAVVIADDNSTEIDIMFGIEHVFVRTEKYPEVAVKVRGEDIMVTCHGGHSLSKAMAYRRNKHRHDAQISFKNSLKRLVG